MGLWVTLRVALSALARNKLRTVLTMLGIIIGIAAVICSVAIGQGGSRQVQQQLENIGDNMVWVESGGRNVNGVRTGNDATKSLTLEDAQAIAQSVPLIRAVSPNVDGHIQIVYGNQNWFTFYRGDAPDFLSIRRYDLASGVMFTNIDVSSLANVCVIGHTVMENLFGPKDPIGKIIRVGSIPCRVIGTLQPKGISGNGWDQDDFIVMPYTTVMHKIKGVNWLDDIFCAAISPAEVVPAQEQIKRLIRLRHAIRPGQPDDFNIRHPEDALQAQVEASHTFTMMLASIASVSLLVGGIGIMNIMLVSVTERTREIGVRMSVGATEQDIRLQFLSEAVVLSILGGAIGVFAGILASDGFSSFLAWPTEVSLPAIMVAAVFSVAIGIFFGYYPASKASQLDPIEALRFE